MRVVIGEDHALLRDGLSRILAAHQMDVVAAVDNATELDAALSDESVDLAVLDVRMPPTFTDEGLQAAIKIRRHRPGFPVLVLSQYVEQLYARELLESGEGAVGYLLKDRVANVAGFIDAVRRVSGGGTVLDPEVVSQLLTGQRSDGPLDRLSTREREVLSLMAEGRSNAAIAEAMFVTRRRPSANTPTASSPNSTCPVSADDNRRVLAVLAYLGV